MNTRGIRLPVLLLVVAVAGSQLLLWWFAPDEKPDMTAGPARSGYTLKNFSLEVLNEDGSIGVKVQAPHLARRDGDGSLYIDQPRFKLPGDAGNRWLGRSEFAWIDADGEVLELRGEVSLHRPADSPLGRAEIVSANVTAWLAEQRLRSFAATTIKQPGRILRGTGMKVDLATHTMELLADVHGIFQAVQ